MRSLLKHNSNFTLNSFSITMKHFLSLISVLAVLFYSQKAHCQEEYVMSYQTKDTLTTCDAIIYDNGGKDGNYQSDSQDTLFIKPGEEGKIVRVDLNSLKIDQDDNLIIYDGLTFKSQLLNYQQIVDTYVIYSNDESGALTVVFNSNSTGSRDGIELEVTCLTAIPEIDLMIFSISADDTCVSGERTYVSGTIFNAGTDRQSSVYVSYYLSEDEILDASDDSITTQYTSSVYGFSHQSYSYYINIPNDKPSGNYYLIVKTFQDYNPAEAQQENNWGARPVYIEEANYDLQTISIQMSENLLAAGSSVNIDYGYRTNGNVTTETSSFGLFLSRDLVLDENDIPFYSSSLPSVMPNQDRYYSTNFTMPLIDSIETGIYYMILDIDNDDMIDETDESNNLALMQVFYEKDEGESNSTLSVENILIQNFNIISDTISPESLVSYSIDWVNQSDHNVYNVEYRIYLSKNSTYEEEDDVVLMNRTNYRIYSFDTLTNINGVRMPQTSEFNYELGDYYLLYALDPENNFEEENEDDNFLAEKVHITNPTFDIEVLSNEISSQEFYEGLIPEFLVRVKNIGYADINNAGLKTTVSENPEYSNTDTIFDINSLSILPVGLERNVYQYLPAVSQLLPGNYYMHSFIDYNNDIDEVNETNNTATIPFTVKAIENRDSIDLSVQSFTVPDSIEIGKSTEFTFEHYFYGINPSECEYAVYFSTDSIFDADDLKYPVASSRINPSAFNVVTARKSLTLPDNIANGKGYLVIKVDSRNLVFENNESNNILIRPIQVLPATADLYLKSLTLSTITYTKGAPINGRIFYHQTGTLLADSVQLRIYISLDNEFSEDAGLVHSDTFKANYYSSYYDFEGFLPDTLSDTNYYIFCIIEVYDKDLIESDFSDNEITKVIGVHSLDVDWELLSFKTYDSTSFPSGYLNVQSNLINAGDANAPSTDFSYFLSLDKEFSIIDDIKIKEYDALTYGIQIPSSYKKSIQLPNDIEPGTYYVLAVIDSRNIVPESNELNNMGIDSIKVLESGIDLKMDTCYTNTPEILNNKNSITIHYSAQNIGNEYASSSYSYLYLSADSIFDASDKMLGSNYLYGLYPGSSSTFYISAQFPKDIEAGEYYFFLKLDGRNEYVELNEDNNIGTVKIKIQEPQVDLEIRRQNNVDTLYLVQNRDELLKFAVTNNGIHYFNGSYQLEHFFSLDTILNPLEDALLATGNISTFIDTKGTAATTIYSSIPESVPEGLYYSFYQIDRLNAVKETNEENNYLRIPTKVISTPEFDLTVENIVLQSDTLIKGKYTNVTFDVSNIGHTSCDFGLRIECHLSADSILDENDLYCFSEFVSQLAVGSSRNLIDGFSVPSAAPLGKAYLLISISNSYDEYELNTDNDIGIASIIISTPNIDLVVQEQYASSVSAAVGDYVDISCQVKNIGNSDANSSYVYYYFSNDTVYDASDYYIASDYVGYLNAGSSSFESASFYVPSGYNGTNYILFVVDRDNNVAEINDTNNTSYVTLRILTQDVDLIPKNLTILPETGSLYDIINVDYEIHNQGSATVSEDFSTVFYFSKDTIPSSNDSLMYGNWVGLSISGNSMHSFETDLYVPHLPAGKYYIICSVDSDEEIAEVNELNNFIHVPFTVENLDIDLIITESYYVIPDEDDEELTIFTKIENKGTEDCNEISSVHVFLSMDKVVSNDDYYIDSVPFSYLSAGETIENYLVADLDISEFNDYEYLLIYVDYIDVVVETNENNNLYWHKWNMDQYDLELTTPFTVGVAEPGESIILESTVSNIGGLATPSTPIEYYFSKDDLWGVEDSLVLQSTIAGIDPNQSITVSHTLFIPENIDEGNYVVFIRINPYDDFVEIDYSNNNTQNVYYNISHSTGMVGVHSSDLKVYPNPTNNLLWINSAQDFQGYQIANILGEIVQQGSLLEIGEEIDVSTLPSGLYHLLLFNKGQRQIVHFEVVN